jgi:hypothetical protein
MDMTAAAVNELLPGLAHRPNELGRIRLGHKAQKDGKSYPAKLDKFRLTSASKPLLEAAAALYGGPVRPWADAPDPGFFELYTEATELDVLIPTNIRTISQRYELWEGATCQRRCDGTIEQLTDGPCLCDPDARDCDLMTRLSLMLPRVPGFGVWRLDTQGYHAATTIPPTIELLRTLTPAPWVPAILRAEQRSKRVNEDGKTVTHRWVQPVIDLPNVTVAAMLDTIPEGEGPVSTPLLEAAARSAPPTARERAAARRAELERPATVTAPDAATSPPSSDEPPHPANTSGAPPTPAGRARSGRGPADAGHGETGRPPGRRPAGDAAPRPDEPPHPAEASAGAPATVRPAGAPNEGAARSGVRHYPQPSEASAPEPQPASGARAGEVLCGNESDARLGPVETCAKAPGHTDAHANAARTMAWPNRRQEA